jgi:NAD(P)-dependent dehydrogenase (short-subunit alcohol dehydrogenase family)
MRDFEDRVVLVTGATSGIGRAAVMQLVARGAKVVAAGRREDLGRELVETARAAGGSVLYVPCDITDSASIDALFARIEAEYGRLDAAFNNAGTEADLAKIPDTPLEIFDQVFAINVRGTFQCLRHEIRIMRAQKRGAIVNTASIAGIIGYADAAVYTASKHAVVGLTKAAGLEYPAQGVRVNCLLPGATRSAMSERWADRMSGGEAEMAQAIPMQRLGKPEEQAAVAVFLLSDAAAYMTGANVVVDGGLSVP